MMLSPLASGAAALWVFAGLPAGQPLMQTPAVTTLQPSDAILRHLSPGETARFQIPLRAGEFSSLVVEQRGIDVVVAVTDGEGIPIDTYQDEPGFTGAEHVGIAAATDGVYALAISPGDGATAPGDYEIRLAPPRPVTETDRRLLHAHALRTRARQAERRGRFAEARPLLEQAQALAESALGANDLFVGMIVFDLAGNALERQDNAGARALYEQAIRVFDAARGAAHPYPAMARSRLALLDERAGHSQKAEAQIREVLPLLEKALGPDHPWVLGSYVTLANLRSIAGDLDQAEQIERRAIAAIERSGQSGTMLHATLLNNLADIQRTKGDDAAAETLFRQSLAIAESVTDGESLFVATALQNLGILARQRKDYAAAIASYARALSIRERLLGPDHPSLAGVLTNLANVYRATGNDRQALETHFRALRMWEKSVGLYGRETLLVVGNIARTYAGMGDIPHALEYQRRADAILETQMSLYVATGSERQKLAFVRTQSERTDRTLSLHLRQAPDDADAASLAALVLLQRKGRVQDAMTDLFASVRQRAVDSADRDLLDQLKDTTASLARIALGGPGVSQPGQGESVAQIEARREQLEARLSGRSADFRARMQPVTLETVQAAIPGDAVLIEFAVFRPFDPEAERNEEAYGPAHYAAYVIGRHGTPTGIDLGAVEDIDALVVRMRESLRNPDAPDMAARARALDERVMRPLRASLNGATRLLISPDGGLNLVPFEALVDEHGRYLIERYGMTYFTSGRDLLRMEVPKGTPGRPLIVADPLFGEPAGRAVARNRTGSVRRSVTGGREIGSLYFAPLSGSAAEARAIKSLFPDATLLTGRRATKASLETASAPSILHIASHGFFLEDAGLSGSLVSQNPLLRSGLALAGANLPGPAQGDGILTALEAAGLDLWGTHLVTLSACDTGVGEVRNGEGVYGLRRAFILAGAETLVMSLWPVSDAVARDTMVAYYARLRTGMGRGDALRQAKLSILKRPAMRHPYYWAGFIQSGDWTRLPTPR